MPARRPLAALCSLAGLLAAAPGCVWYGPHSMTRIWGDRNTLDRPALYVERLSHAPPPRERVERFRWQYGAGPGIPFVAPETMYVTSPTPEASGTAAPVPPTGGLPAAPPPEAIPGAVEAPKPRANLAWLFSPARG